MKDYFYLIPIALGLGVSALAAFMWSLKTGQYDDLEGAAVRILEEDDVPIPTKIRAVTSRPSAECRATWDLFERIFFAPNLVDQLLVRTP